MSEAEELSPQELAAAAASWARNTSIPKPVGSERLVLDSLRGLGAIRRQVRAFLTSGCPMGSSPEACEDAVDRAVPVIDELTSNAVRHGLPPSSLQVCDDPGRWLVIGGTPPRTGGRPRR